MPWQHVSSMVCSMTICKLPGEIPSRAAPIVPFPSLKNRLANERGRCGPKSSVDSWDAWDDWDANPQQFLGFFKQFDDGLRGSQHFLKPKGSDQKGSGIKFPTLYYYCIICM